MRADLLDAKASVDWAKAQIPILQDRLITWQRQRPYRIVAEPDPVDEQWDRLVSLSAYPACLPHLWRRWGDHQFDTNRA
jgi:hypothetical protein